MGVQLKVDALMDRARKETGLKDYGDEWFVEPLTHLVGFINREAGLPSEDVWPVQFLVKNLADRLRLAEYLKNNPKVRDEKIEAVGVIISGRGGSTFLQRLLGSSPQLTSLRSWEGITPVPLPDEKPGENAKRLELGKQHAANHDVVWPEFKAIHPIDPMAYEEELYLMDRSFVSQMYPSYFPITSYNHWETTIDQTKNYEDLKLWLQVMQHQDPSRKGKKWILKTVQHLLTGGLPYLAKTFPEAKIIMTHRNLVDVLSSWCSAQAVLLRPAQSTTFDVMKLGPRIMDMYREGLEHFIAARKILPADRFIDVQYKDMMKDTLGTHKWVMQAMGLTVMPEDEKAAAEWLSRNGRDTHPRHHYRPEDYGMTKEMLESTFKFYHDAFVK